MVSGEWRVVSEEGRSRQWSVKTGKSEIKKMRYVSTCDAPFSLDDLAAQIRKSSSFRFAWQFYSWSGADPRSPAAARWALTEIIATPELHHFLRESFEPLYAPRFEISPLHNHSEVLPADDEFEHALAGAAADRTGAYARCSYQTTPGERQAVHDLFCLAGDYATFHFVQGNVPGCAVCGQYNGQLFTTWFYGVAWDWCLMAAWPARDLFWLGCLTDTD